MPGGGVEVVQQPNMPPNMPLREPRRSDGGTRAPLRSLRSGPTTAAQVFGAHAAVPENSTTTREPAGKHGVNNGRRSPRLDAGRQPRPATAGRACGAVLGDITNVSTTTTTTSGGRIQSGLNKKPTTTLGQAGAPAAAPQLGGSCAQRPSLGQPARAGEVAIGAPLVHEPASSALLAPTLTATTGVQLARHAAPPPPVNVAVPPMPVRAPHLPAEGGGAEDAQMQSCVEYANDIIDHLFRDEVEHLPHATYMDGQSDINSRMRAILIDWLIEVHMKYKLRRETLYLTVNLIDRYLTRMPVMRRRLQLVGVVAMFIAAKFEEISPPEVSDFVYITDNAYTKDDILTMECTMLQALHFHLVVPTPAHFLPRVQQENACDETHAELVHYLIELSLLDIQMIRYTPSHIVAAAVLLSNELLGRGMAWPAHMAEFSRHREPQLRACAEEIRSLLQAAPTNHLKAVYKKYCHDACQRVARLV
mmetsp:Transcript_46294/g.110170  ORF Transcript_46294/g.110170 Transcript_46294/m.110170 type:complete len:476 (-) Transcript_46294:376-1803(-)